MVNGAVEKVQKEEGFWVGQGPLKGELLEIQVVDRSMAIDNSTIIAFDLN